MTDIPTNPQQIIDDATKKLEEVSPNMQTQPMVDQPLVETPAEPEIIVIPPKDQTKEPSPPVIKPPKKKGGKGMLIGILLFFILTLPVAIYYGSQKYQQITEGRSRAAGRCEQKNTAGLCVDIECIMYTTQTSCTSGTGMCCKWTIFPTPTRPVATNTPTRQPTTGGLPECPNTDCQIDSTIPEAIHCTGHGYASTYCCPPAKPLFNSTTQRCTTIPFLKCCAKYNTTYAHTTCLGATEGGCRANPNYCIPWSSPTCPEEIAVTSTPTPGGGGGGGGNWHCNGGTGSPPPIPIACTNGGTYNGKCIIYHCPQGCGGSTCGESSPGVWWEYKSCATASLTGNECGQIDTVTDSNRYCSPTTGCSVKQLVCNSTCSGGPTRPLQETNTPEPGATDTPKPTNTPTIANTSAPGTCDASCDTDSNCESGLSCQTVTGIKRCRKSDCPNESSCSCPAATPTERVIYVQQPTSIRVIAEAPIATETQRPTPKVPVSGGLFDIKAIIITVGSILLLTLGLIL